MKTFIDLFAGIGGMRLAFELTGAECVFSSEWDRFAQRTYAANFGETPAGDICDIDAADIPDHDALLAGFPCQPFSIAGVSKKNSLATRTASQTGARATSSSKLCASSKPDGRPRCCWRTCAT